MDPEFDKCLKRGLEKVPVSDDLIQKELAGAKDDLDGAKKIMAEGNHKWASVMAYYSMFHTACALLYSKGYREKKSHVCLAVGLRVLFVETKEIEEKHLERLNDCKNLREEADYSLASDNESAGEAIGWADEFLQAAKGLIGKHAQSESKP